MFDEQKEEAIRLENEAKYTIIRMEDDNDVHKKQILEDAKSELTKLFEEFRLWVDQNVHTEQMDERFAKLKKDSVILLDKTKRRLQDLYMRDDVQDGKEKFKQAGKKVKACVDDGVQDILENEYIEKAVQTLQNTYDGIRNDEHVKSGIKMFKRGTLQAAQCAFDGIKRILDSEVCNEDDSQKGSNL